MYEHIERLFQGLAPTSEHLKGVYYELADEFFRQLRQQIEITQNELREGEQLEIYYQHAQGEEPVLVSKMGYISPGLLVLYGKDGQQNDCKVLAHLQTVHLSLKLVRNGAPEKRRTMSFVEQTRD
jgi:predicted ribosome quality control (RQC) complex YloA/Tae2 family protein